MPKGGSPPCGRWWAKRGRSGAKWAQNPRFRDLLSAFSAAEVRFLVVGAHAVSFHAVPRYTKDIDLWVEPTPENAKRAWDALALFGAPLEGVEVDDLATPGTVIQIGVEPNRIDILTRVAGLEFPATWERRVGSTYSGIPVAFPSLDDLLDSKRACGARRTSSTPSGSRRRSMDAWRHSQGEGSLREKGASMNTHVCWMLELQVREGRDEEFRALMAEMAVATGASEPGTLDYEWSLSADGRQCHLWERYADSAAAMVHAATFGSRYAARFFDVLAPVRLVLYGSPSGEVRAALAAFNPVVMEPAAGFSR